jgi:hypothetical protein
LHERALGLAQEAEAFARNLDDSLAKLRLDRSRDESLARRRRKLPTLVIPRATRRTLPIAIPFPVAPLEPTVWSVELSRAAVVVRERPALRRPVAPVILVTATLRLRATLKGAILAILPAIHGAILAGAEIVALTLLRRATR